MSNHSDRKKNPTVLVAEDSSPNRAILVGLLKKLGFGVIECVDGTDAIRHLQNERGPDIACVISDIMMKHMDGLELLKKVRENPKTVHLPFLLITAISEREPIIEAARLKASGYILKPLTFQMVSSKLQEVFPQHDFTIKKVA